MVNIQFAPMSLRYYRRGTALRHAADATEQGQWTHQTRNEISEVFEALKMFTYNKVDLIFFYH